MSHRILHADLDQFLAAAELLRRPELAGLPLVVGGDGDPDSRTVVATASYEARAYGVRSGMPMRLARRRCPGAVFLPSDKPYYEEVSEQVMGLLRDLGEPVEVIGWDEAFVGTDGDPWALAERIRETVSSTGLSCAVGIGDNTLRAKTATGYAKPGGVHELTAANWFATLGADPPEALPGIGRATARALAELGITTVTELAESRPGDVAARLGPNRGPYYVSLGRGMGRTELDTGPWVPRSRSRETTFPADLTDRSAMHAELRTLAHRVAADVAGEDRDCVRVGIRVRTRSFRTTTRSRALDPPGRDGDVIAGVAVALLDEMAPDRPVRLLGVRAELDGTLAR
ncbi:MULTISPECIES: DNA polymerase IV [unclassified Pseudonocardia]|uniref:DNA polymerase IV n=1 Tax=unclassified Pseudonocardia TaxID=2619320 RepID=UPI0001FFDE84|nr:DNA polymerase IV [Pseudonocardia sp. Ae707_Ps1]OLM17708.1 DNA polymerase-like protein [Pseudonocardia sp. Ae707_Ps1]